MEAAVHTSRRRPRQLMPLPARSTPARCIPRYGTGAGQLPDLRHGAGAAACRRIRRRQRRTAATCSAASGSACALALPVFVLEMGGHLPALNLHHLVGMRASQWIQFALATPVVLWAGWPFFVRAVASVRHRSLNMFSLIALGVGAALLYSLAALFLPGWFPAALRSAGRHRRRVLRSRAVITVLVLLGQVLELRARERTGGAIRALLKLAPKTARRLDEQGDEQEIPLEEVQPGDRLRVRPGDSVPVDGVVLEGRGGVDESMITGESLPVAKAAGRKADRRHHQRHRRAGDARREGRRGHDADAHRAHGGRRAAQPRAHPAAGRPGLRLVRARGHRAPPCSPSRRG